jgi:hypothetical protein
MLDFLRWDVECCHYGQSWDGVRGLGSILWPNWEFLGSGMDYGLELGIVSMSARLYACMRWAISCLLLTDLHESSLP